MGLSTIQLQGPAKNLFAQQVNLSLILLLVSALPVPLAPLMILQLKHAKYLYYCSQHQVLVLQVLHIGTQPGQPAKYVHQAKEYRLQLIYAFQEYLTYQDCIMRIVTNQQICYDVIQIYPSNSIILFFYIRYVVSKTKEFHESQRHIVQTSHKPFKHHLKRFELGDRAQGKYPSC